MIATLNELVTIEPSWRELRAAFAAAVTTDGGRLKDHVTGLEVAVNQTAAVLLHLLNDGWTLGEVCDSMSRQSGTPISTIRDECLDILYPLNELLVVEISSSAHIADLLRQLLTALSPRRSIESLTAGSLIPGPRIRLNVRRTDIAPLRWWQRMAVAGRHLMATVLMTGMFASLAAFAAASAVGASPLPIGLAVGAVVASSLWLHELGHVAAVGRNPFAIKRRGLSLAVVSARRCADRRISAASGSLLPAGIGTIGVAVGWATGSAPLAAAGAAFTLQLVGLLHISSDGRNLL